jgi:hypothetical protein
MRVAQTQHLHWVSADRIDVHQPMAAVAGMAPA